MEGRTVTLKQLWARTFAGIACLFAAVTPVVNFVWIAYARRAHDPVVQWLNIWGVYAALITVPLVVALSLSVLFSVRPRPQLRQLRYLTMFGSVIGLVASLFLLPVTGGASVLFGATAGAITLAAAWVVRIALGRKE